MVSMPADQEKRERFANEWEKNFSVVAAAGSGKTRAITDRIVRLALNPKAREILPTLVVVTFTNRAADEMQRRARQQILEARTSTGARVEPDVLAAFNRAFFGTIHSFCLKLLTNYGHHLGLPATLELLKDDNELWNQFVQQTTRIGHSLTKENREKLLRHIPVRQLMELGRRGETDALLGADPGPYPDVDFEAVYDYPANQSQNIKESQETLHRWEERWRKGDAFLRWPVRSVKTGGLPDAWKKAFAPLRGWVNACALSVAREVQYSYREFRLERGTLTYDDQVALANQLLQQPDAARRIRARNYRVILDEAQDTDPLQFSVFLEVTRPIGAEGRWLKTLKDPPRPGHFCMVGDRQQSIYGRRADLAQYRRIHEALKTSAAGEELEFSVTFRLDQQQLDCVTRSFSNILKDLGGQVPFAKLDPRPDVLPGQVVRLDLHAVSLGERLRIREKDAAAAEQLARWLGATSLEKLRARSWRDVAILCPRKKWLHTLSRALRRAGFSVQIQSENELKADSPAYAWLTALCTIMAEPALDYEIVGVLREVFGLSDHDLAVFAQGYGDRFQILEATAQTGAVAETLTLLRQTREAIEAQPLFTAVRQLIERTKLRARLAALPTEDFEGLESELDALLASAATAEAEGKTLGQFAEFLRGNFEAEREIQPGGEQAIQLITSYKAKGSEWQAVIVPFLAREVRTARPSYPKMVKAPFSGELVVAMDGDDMTDELKAEQQKFERQEMERLLYVALTRARHTLVLAFDEKIFAKANGEVNPKSQMRWLQACVGEANAEHMAALPGELSACAATQTRQEEEAQTRASEDRVPPFAALSPNEQENGRAQAAHFVQKRNPSELAAHFRVLSGVAVDVWNETDPELRPLLQESAAMRYGVWWHEFAQRLPWQSETFLLGNSPDPARSEREWKMLRERLTIGGDLRKALRNSDAVLHPEFPFLWRLDESNCVEGIIDLALFNPREKKWLIIDWKTNRITPNESEALREQYRPQLAAYWKAVSEMTKLPVEAAIYSTTTGELLRYTPDELGEEWSRFLD